MFSLLRVCVLIVHTLAAAGTPTMRCLGFYIEGIQRQLLELRVAPGLGELNGSATLGAKRFPYNLVIDDW